MGWFGRAYAAFYDRQTEQLDRRETGAYRRRLVEDADGEVLEVGVGTGRNLPLYQAARRVVGVEPEPGMRRRAEARVGEARVPVTLLDGDAQDLPFPDASFDTVVCSAALCSIPDVGRALAELRRVLRPGGILRFWEHVRSEDPRLAAWQDRLATPWRWLGRGCHDNRDTVAAIREAGFEIMELDRFDLRYAPPVVRPHVLGTARAPL